MRARPEAHRPSEHGGAMRELQGKRFYPVHPECVGSAIFSAFFFTAEKSFVSTAIRTRYRGFTLRERQTRRHIALGIAICPEARSLYVAFMGVIGALDIAIRSRLTTVIRSR
jgi:hypothetical protein